MFLVDVAAEDIDASDTFGCWPAKVSDRLSRIAAGMHPPKFYLENSLLHHKMTKIVELNALLSQMEPVLNPGTYVYVRSKGALPVDHSKIVASIREAEGTSLILEESFAESEGLEPVFKCAWITLYVNSDLAAIGFTAAFSAVLGKAGISCNVVAGINHDHIFVPIHQAGLAMTELKASQEHHRRLVTEHQSNAQRK